MDGWMDGCLVSITEGLTRRDQRLLTVVRVLLFFQMIISQRNMRDESVTPIPRTRKAPDRSISLSFSLFLVVLLSGLRHFSKLVRNAFLAENSATRVSSIIRNLKQKYIGLSESIS